MKRTMMGSAQSNAAKNTWCPPLRISTYRLFGHSSLSGSESAGGRLRSRSPVMTSAGTFAGNRAPAGTAFGVVGRGPGHTMQTSGASGAGGRATQPSLENSPNWSSGRSATACSHCFIRVATGASVSHGKPCVTSMQKRAGFTPSEKIRAGSGVATLRRLGLGRQPEQRPGVARTQRVRCGRDLAQRRSGPKSPDWRMFQASELSVTSTSRRSPP